MDNRTKEIQMSVAYNNASRLLATIMEDSSGLNKVADSVDELARFLYAKQIKFLEEIVDKNVSK